jgi:Zn-dependent protease with chaperone function
MVHHRLHRFFLVLVILLVGLNVSSAVAHFSLSAINHQLNNICTGKWAVALLDSYCTKNFGAQEADPWIVEKAHEFLGYFQVNQPEQVSIRKLEVPSQSMSLNLDKLSAITLWTGLWFNPNLENSDELLWQIAHESAHFALHHPLKNLYMLKARPILIAGAINGLIIGGMSLLLKNAHFCSSLLKTTLVGLVSVPILVQTYVRLIVAGFNAEKEFERDADLAAAKMLCEHGYASVVEQHLGALANSIEQGLFLVHPYTHPSFVETRDYLQKFWNEWLGKHPEYVLTGQAI